jgi:hypothetical protein
MPVPDDDQLGEIGAGVGRAVLAQLPGADQTVKAVEQLDVEQPWRVPARASTSGREAARQTGQLGQQVGGQRLPRPGRPGPQGPVHLIGHVPDLDGLAHAATYTLVPVCTPKLHARRFHQTGEPAS